MRKWGLFVIIFAAIATLYGWLGDEAVNEGEGFEKTVSIPTKQAKKVSGPIKPSQSKEMQKPPTEASIALDKSIDSRMASQFEPKGRGPTSLSAYFGSVEMRMGRRKYFVSHELRSIPTEFFEGHMGTEVVRENGYVFFEASETRFGLPTLYNVRNKSLGLITGRILLKDISLEQARSIAGQYGSELDFSMAHLGVYAFVAGMNVIAISQEIGQGAELEIFEGRIREK